MANKCDSPKGEQAMSSQRELTWQLERELEKRRLTSEDTNAPGSTRSSDCKLLAQLADCYSKISKISPSKKGNFHGLLRKAPTVGTDSNYLPGGVSGFNSEGIMERKSRAVVRMLSSPERRLSCVRASSSTGIAASGEGGAGQPPMSPNSTVRSSEPSAGRARGGFFAAPSNGAANGKGQKRKRNRSQNPPPMKIEVPKEEFLSTVQMHTGYEDPSVVSKQREPRRTRSQSAQADAYLPTNMGVNGSNPPARPSDFSLTLRMREVKLSPTPTVSDRFPGAGSSIGPKFSSPSTSSGSSKHSSLNYCMGYDGEGTPLFLEDQQHDYYDENLGQLPEDGHSLASGSAYRSDSGPMIQSKKHSTPAALRLPGASVPEAAPLHPGSKENEGIPREESSLFSGISYSGSGSQFFYPFMKPSSVLELPHRPQDISFDSESEGSSLDGDMADSFLNC